MRLFAERALLDSGWAEGVLLTIGGDGLIHDQNTLVRHPPPDVERVAGTVLPGMPNLHSHAFQRAFAGAAERRGPGEDSFWTWREAMYRLVANIDPDAIESIAAQLFVEMLESGYTSVGEFHYLHHDRDGRRYACLAETSERIVAAAQQTGIALTLLPVLYTSSGFGGKAPSTEQRRFVNDVERYGRLLETLFSRHRRSEGIRIGAALHSLRAVTPEDLDGALRTLHAMDARAPVHIHVSEQIREVEDCVRWCGQRPVEWLLQHADVDERWCLVHATHLMQAECTALAASDATVGLCPTTEANLGDGVFPALDFVGTGGRFGIGSDSHVSVSPVEELRWLEYGQRLMHRRRNLLASEHSPSVGRFLYEHAARNGARALGHACGALAPGRRADLVVVDSTLPTLEGRHGDEMLDTLVFAGNANAVRDVMVGGRWRVREGRHPERDSIRQRFSETLRKLRES